MIKNENTVSLRTLRQLHPGNISIKTIRRWCRQGLLDKGGNRVTLESWREGGERFTTLEAYERFIHALNK